MQVAKAKYNKMSSLAISGTKVTEIVPVKNRNNNLELSNSKTLPTMTKINNCKPLVQPSIINKANSKSKIPISCSRSKKELRESESKINRSVGFLKKIIGIKKSKTSSEPCLGEVFVRDYSFENKSTRIFESTSNTSVNTKSSFTINEYSSIHLTLTQAINEMVTLGIKINDSEANVRDMIIKYINDKTVKNNLCVLIRGHNQLLMDSEIRALNIGDDLLLQTENYRNQIKSLQETISSLLQKNRELQAVQDELIQNNEALGSASAKIQDLSKTNGILKSKLEIATKKIEDLDNNLRKLQRKKCAMEEQLNNSNMQLNTTKITFDLHKAKQDLEITKLNQEICAYSLEIKQSKEIADLLVEDIRSSGLKFKILTQNINLDTFMKNERSLTDFINLGRSYLNNLFKELNAKDDEIKTLVEDKKYVLRDLNELKILKSSLEQEVTLLNENITNFRRFETDVNHKCDELVQKISVAEIIINENVLEINEKDINIKNLEEKIDNYKQNENENQDLIDSLKTQIQNIEQDKTTLQSQICGLAHVLSASGSGEIAKELVNIQEKLTRLQGQYFELMNEKKDLMAVVQSSKEEKQTLLAYQKNFYDQLEEQHNISDSLGKSKSTLKEQLEKEKTTVLALQTERVRHLEEKSALTAMVERLKNEISKMDHLEGTVSTMNYKANQFAIIAEYNMQLGQVLQNQVAERDVAINELQQNVKTLATKHAKSHQEKIALCEELVQVSGVKEVLNTKLINQLDKNISLDKHQKNVEVSANQKVKELEGMYEKEHVALKNLVKESKKLIKQRDSLLSKNTSLDEKIKEVCKEKQNLFKKVTNLKIQLKESKSTIKDMEKDFADKTSEGTMITMKLEQEITKYKQNCDNLNEDKSKLTEESTNLKIKMDHLQTYVNKLQKDLDLSRNCEITFKRLCENFRVQNENHQEDMKSKEHKIASLLEQKLEIQEELLELQNNLEVLTEQVLGYESERNEVEIHQKHATKTKQLERLYENRDFSDIETEIYEKNEAIVEIQEKMRFIEKLKREEEKIIIDQSIQQEKLIKDNEKLQSELARIKMSFLEKNETTMELENQLYNLEKEFENKHRSIMEQNEYYKQYIEELRSEANKDKDLLQEDLNKMSSNLNEENLKFNSLQDNNKRLEKSHRDLAMKLFKAVQALIAEKLHVQKIGEKVKISEDEITLLKIDIVKLNEQLKIKEREIHHLEKKLEVTESEKKSLEVNLSHLETNKIEKYNALLAEKQELVERIKQELSNEEIRRKDSRACSQENSKESSIAEFVELHEAFTNLKTKYDRLEFQKAENVLRLYETQSKLKSAYIQIELQEATLKKFDEIILKLIQEGKINYSDYSDLLMRTPDQCEKSCV